MDFDGANDSLAGQSCGITGSVSVVTVCRFDALSQPSGDYEYALPFYGVRRPILIDMALCPGTSAEPPYSGVGRKEETLAAEVRSAT